MRRISWGPAPFFPGAKLKLGRHVYQVTGCRRRRRTDIWPFHVGWSVVIARPRRWTRLGMPRCQVVPFEALAGVKVIG